jgi:hypothetical protein
MSKVLPVVIGDKRLSVDLKKISVAHVFSSDVEKYNSMFDSGNRTALTMVNRLIIVSDVDILENINNSTVCFVHNPLTHTEDTISKVKSLCANNNCTIEFHTSVNDKFMFSELDNMYTEREIKSLKTTKISVSDDEKIDLTFIFVGKPKSVSGVQKLMDDFKHNTAIAGNIDSDEIYIINENTLQSHYLTFEDNSTAKLLAKFCNTQTYIPTIDVTDPTHIESQNKHNKYIESISHTKYHTLLDMHEYRKKELLSYYAKDHVFDTITMIIDTEKIESLNTKEIRKNIYDCISTDNYNEILYMCGDHIAIGTPHVMRYYCALYECYGSYKYRGDYKQYCLSKLYDTILGRVYYSEYYNYRLNIQLFEHIKAYTNLIVTKVCKIDIKKREIPFILVTYYGIYEQLDFVRQSMEKLGYTVYDYPYKKICSEHTTDDIELHNALVERAKKLLDLKPEYMLWWIIDIPPATMTEIVTYNRRVKHLYFNWDEPFNFDLVGAARKSRLLTGAYVTCQETTVNYTDNGALSAHCVYPGFDPTVHYPYWLKDYICMHVTPIDEYDCNVLRDTYSMRKLITENYDKVVTLINDDFNKREFMHDISFVCTNLYENREMYPDQIVNRKYLVETIYNKQEKFGYSLGLYGSKRFEGVFPDSYQGFIKYFDNSNAFNLSRINMCTHVIGNKRGYLNERVFLILAVGGLLFVDPIESDVLVNGYNCIFIDQNRVIPQIKGILNNYERYTKIKINAYLTAQKYSWDNWGLTIKEKLLELSTK